MLDNALDYGLSEKEFWEMTFSELDRFIDSKQRQEEYRLKERATMDYTLALLIGRSMQGSNEEHPFPELYEVYPNLFFEEFRKQEEEKKEQIAQLSAIRFIQFAESFNSKFDKEANE